MSIEFNYRDTKHGHAVTNTGYSYANSKWRFEHTKIDSDGAWVPVAVEYLELGPSARTEARERFTKAFPEAYEDVSG